MHRYTTILLTLFLCAPLFAVDAAPDARWHHPLYLANGDYWRLRVPVVVTNKSNQPAEGDVVSVDIERDRGAKGLVGADAKTVRVCQYDGTELLYAITGPNGNQIEEGPIPAGSRIALPVVCEPNSQTTLYVYWHNPSTWLVPTHLDLKDKNANDGPELEATAGKRQNIDLNVDEEPPREWPSDAPQGLAKPDYRSPVRVLNIGRDAAENVLAAVSMTRLNLQMPERRHPWVSWGGKFRPAYRMRNFLLFPADIPAHSVNGGHIYFSKDPAPDFARVAGYEELMRSERNLVQNPNFERGEETPAQWTPSPESARPDGMTMGFGKGLFGKRSARFSIPGPDEPGWLGWTQDVTVKPGHTYLCAGWLKYSDLAPAPSLHIHYLTEGGKLTGAKMTSAPEIRKRPDGWRLHAGVFGIPRDCTNFQIHLTMNTTGTLEHDGLLVTEIVGAEVGPPEPREPIAKADCPVVWPVNPIEKVFRSDLPRRTDRPIEISCARNEKEPLQLAVRSAVAMPDLKIEVDAPTNEAGETVTDIRTGVVDYVPIDCKSEYYQYDIKPWERPVPMKDEARVIASDFGGGSDGWGGWWPDPLMPTDKFDLEPFRTQPVWVTFSVGKDASAGVYRGVVRLVNKDETVRNIAFTLRVRDFTLPDEEHVGAIYDVRPTSIAEMRNRPDKSRLELQREIWKFMADYRLNPDAVYPSPEVKRNGDAVSFDFEEYDRMADIFFNKFKVFRSYTPHLFYVFGWANPPREYFGEKPYASDELPTGDARGDLREEYVETYRNALAKFWKHIQEKGWADKYVLYVSDEPHYWKEGIIPQLQAICDMIHGAAPNIPVYSSTWRFIPEWLDYLDVWGVGHFGVTSIAEMKRIRDNGSRLYFTTDGHICIDTPYCAFARMLPHYCFQYNVEAYEFWGVDWYTWNPFQFGWHRIVINRFAPGDQHAVRYPNGDGYMLYPGYLVGRKGFIPSIRMEQAREGVEDYEYLYMLRNLIASRKNAGLDVAEGKALLDRAARLTPIPNGGGRHSTDMLPNPDEVLTIRDDIAELIEQWGSEDK